MSRGICHIPSTQKGEENHKLTRTDQMPVGMNSPQRSHNDAGAAQCDGGTPEVLDIEQPQKKCRRSEDGGREWREWMVWCAVDGH